MTDKTWLGLDKGSLSAIGSKVLHTMWQQYSFCNLLQRKLKKKRSHLSSNRLSMTCGLAHRRTHNAWNAIHTIGMQKPVIGTASALRPTSA